MKVGGGADKNAEIIIVDSTKGMLWLSDKFDPLLSTLSSESLHRGGTNERPQFTDESVDN